MTDPASDSTNGPKPAEEPVIGADLEAALSAQEAAAEAQAKAGATPGGSGIHHRVGIVELRFTQLMVAVMTSLVLASAITRSIGRPQSWTVDMALLTFAWAVFVGADVALRNGRMVNIDLVIARLPSKVRAVVNLFNAVLIIVFLAAMVGLGAWLSYTTRDRSFSGLPWLSYTWVTLAVPVGCALMLWTSLRNWGRQVEEFRAPESGPLTKRGRTVAAAQGEGGGPVIGVLIIFMVLIVLGMPIAFAIGISGFFFFLTMDNPLFTIPVQLTLTQTQNFAMLAIPLFVLAGNLLNETGITRRLMHFASALTGHLRAGLAHINFTLAFMLGGVTSSAIGDATMLGRILGPGMRARNYAPGFSAGIIGSSSIITTMVPPGTGLILYGTLGEVSIGQLFTGGVVPGILITLLLMVAVSITAKRHNYPREHETRAPVKEVARTGLVSIWAILFPILLILGLRSGIFTPSEAGAFAVLYAAVVGVLLYRELTWAKFSKALQDTAIDMGMIMTLIAFSGSWSYGLTWDRVPQRLLGFLTGISDNGIVVMLVLMVALLLVGMFMDSTVLILLLTTMLVPVAVQVGIDPVHFGVVMILTLTLGLLTPPVGIVMYIVCDQFNTDIPTYLRESVYLFGALVLTILLMVFVPGIVTWLPRLLYGGLG